MGDTNAIPTGVWIRAELVDELRTCLTNHVETACMCIDAARAVVDAVKTEDETVPNVLTGERVKPWRTPAHMAAPDELTALRDERDELKAAGNVAYDSMIERGHQIIALRAEHDALTARIRALADEWERNPARFGSVADSIRAALGDA